MAEPAAFTTFATPIGDCAVAWNRVGLTAVWLPETSAARLRARVAKRLPGANEAPAQADVASAIAAITALLRGERTDLGAIRIDDSRLDVFDRRVSAAARTIAPGRVVTMPIWPGGSGPTRRHTRSASRSGAIPFRSSCRATASSPPAVSSAGSPAPGGTATKRRLLTIEDARLDGVADLFDEPLATS